MKERLVFPPGFHFDCMGCGRCCRGWNIAVDRRCRDRLAESDFYRIMKEQAGREPLEEDDDGFSTARVKGACIFLDEEDTCRIHRSLGYDAKPLGCRLFPLMIKPTPGGIYVGMSFYCPSCQQNSGRPLEEHAGALEAFLQEHHFQGVSDDTILLAEGLPLSWHEYVLIEERVVEKIGHGGGREKTLRRILAAMAQTLLALAPGDSPSALFGRYLKGMDQSDDSVFEEMALFFTLAVVGVMEAQSPPEARNITESAMSGGIFRSLTFEKDISMADFSRYYRENPLPWKEEALGRYCDHLIFRKFLTGPEPLFHNLAALVIIYGLADFYLYLSAFQRGSGPPLEEDCAAAFSIVEKGFTAHTRTMVPFFKAFAEGFLDIAGKAL